MVNLFAIAAICLVPPVDGPIVTPYSPIGQYGGHWGIDFEAHVGEPVHAPASGVVTFAGSVAGMKTITIQPVGGFKVSVSYLSDVGVSQGDYVRRGSPVGAAGVEDGVPGVHMSTRIDGQYVDPRSQLGCRSTDITRALRLVTPPQPYPRTRAHRNPRRNVRPDPHRSSARRRSRASSGRSRQDPLHAGRYTLAKVRSGGDAG